MCLMLVSYTHLDVYKRQDIDYGFAEAHTTYGRIGVKVWIYKGEVLNARKARPAAAKEGGR